MAHRRHIRRGGSTKGVIRETLLAPVPNLLFEQSEEAFEDRSKWHRQALEWLVGYWTEEEKILFQSDDVKDRAAANYKELMRLDPGRRVPKRN
jgi:hypothetical protein